jgi:hypothetical protein
VIGQVPFVAIYFSISRRSKMIPSFVITGSCAGSPDTIRREQSIFEDQFEQKINQIKSNQNMKNVRAQYIIFLA